MVSPSEMKSKDILEAQSHVWNDLFSFIKSMSLKFCIQLGIADAVHNHGGPITLTELAAALSVPSCRLPSFKRLMTFLSHIGYFEETDDDTYALTPNSAVLIKGQSHSITPMIDMVLDERVMAPYHSLSEWVTCERPSTAFEKFHGKYVWEAAAEIPELGRKFLGAMGSDAAAVAKVLVEECGDVFEGVKSVVEVAGAVGEISLAVTKAFPGIKCTVLDLAPMIDMIEKDGVVEYVAGDMFEHIPPADALILKWVLMTWSDEECVKILKRCKEAIPTKENGGKVIIIEKVMDTSVHNKMTETHYFYDIQMLVHTEGRQRTEADWKKLFTEAGFKDYKIIPAMGMRCIIEIYH